MIHHNLTQIYNESKVLRQMAGGVRYRFSEWAEHTAPIFTLPENTAKGQIGVVVKGNTEVDELGNVKSTVSAMRLKSVGKNLLRNGNGENGTMYWNPLTPDSFIFNGEYFEKVGGKGTTVYSDYFKLSSGQYCISSIGQSLISSSFQIDLFDENGVTLGTYYHDANLAVAGVTISLTESKNVRIRLLTGRIENHFIIKQIQLERNTVATPYEPYTESTQYITAKDDEGKIVELRSLPNGTKDEMDVTDRKLIKRIGEKSNIANGMEIDFADMAEGGTYYAWNEDGETETGIKGDTLGIDATTLIYQLNDPIILDTVEVEYTENGQPSDHLKAWGPNTTIIVEVPEDSTIPTILESHVEVVI